jgi:ABC-2 type transport system permease protein
MNMSWQRVLSVARREFLATVRRKAFLFTLVGTPAYFAFVMSLSAGTEVKERKQVLEELTVLGVVDSSGLFGNAPKEIRTELRQTDNPFGGRGAAPLSAAQSFHTDVRLYADRAGAETALRSGQISQLLVIPADYLQTGDLRRFARKNNLFSEADRRAISGWLARSLVQEHVSADVAARVARPAEREAFYTLDRDGNFELKDNQREMLDFMVPFVFSMTLGICIIIGGQYLLQGVAEEKESRILESLLCTVSSEELLAGKLFGLGGVGLFVVGIWAVAGMLLAGPALAFLPLHFSPWLIWIAVGYFLLGYLFYGSIMTGIGAVTNNMREAQQFAVWFTFANFAPFIMITRIVGHPASTLAVALSLFPPTAPTSMLLRMTAPSSAVPAWQIALSLGLLALAAWVALIAVARIFRVALLMYGKTPTLPEILRWVRQAA